MQNPAYIPIDCSFYDNLEAFAITQKIVEINYLDINYRANARNLFILFYFSFLRFLL